MAKSTRPDRYEHEKRFYREKVGPTTSVAISTAGSNRVVLETGRYRLFATEAGFIRQGSVTVTATATDYPMTADSEAWIEVDSSTTNGGNSWDGEDCYIAAIGVGGGSDGNLRCTLVSRLTAAN